MTKIFRPKVLFMEARENIMGHRRQNAVLLTQLSTFADVTSVYPENWLKVKTTISYSPKFNFFSNFFTQYVKAMKSLLFARQLDKIKKFHYIFFSSYNIFSIPLLLFLFRETHRIFLLHHAVLDQIDEKNFKAKIKKFCLSMVIKHVHHVFIEAFPAEEFASRYRVDYRFIHYFPHQYNKISEKQSVEIMYDYVGISNSNDEDWIAAIIQNEILKQTFKKARLHILIRSSKSSFDNGYLCVFNGILSDTDYNNAILKANKILVPFPKNFKFRVSGTIMDALSNKKVVVGSKIPMLERYSQKYPHVCKIGITIDDLLKYSKIDKGKEALGDFELFASEHTAEKITNALKNMFLVKNDKL